MTSTAATLPASVTTVPLNKLILSPRNVRRHEVDEDIDSLSEDIATRGLIHNLIVTESATGKGFYEVDAGGRRWRALQRLAEQKRLPSNWPVPVRIEARELATETSLAENVHRRAMNPADEVEAYRAVLEEKRDSITSEDELIANLARRFGRTERHIRQRLRLADLEPTILAALRDRTISLDTAEAYASHPDHKLQLKVFKAQAKAWKPHDPTEIRKAFAGKVYASDHLAVRYIGVDAYLAAGGRVEPDLFLGSAERELLLDTGLVDKLVREKAAAEAQRLAQADGWLDGLVKPWSGPDWADPKPPAGFVRDHTALTQLTPESRAEMLVAFELGVREGGEAGLVPHRYAMRWRKAQEVAQAPSAPAYQPETPEQREARERAAEIDWLAVHIAAPEVKGTPLEGRAFWPTRHAQWIEPVIRKDEETFLVALMVEVKAADIEAARAEAEARYEREQAELAEEERATAADEGDDDQLDGEPEPVLAAGAVS